MGRVPDGILYKIHLGIRAGEEKSVPENWSVTAVSTHRMYMERRGVMF